MKKDRLTGLRRCMMFFIIQLVVGMAIGTSSAYGQQKVLDVKFDNATLLEVLTYLSDHSGCVILYNHEQLKDSTRINQEFKKSTLAQILDKCLENTRFTYRVVDGVYAITLKGEQPKERIVVSGTVKDEAGQPMPGATIMLKGTRIGVVADKDGKFQLEVSRMKDLRLVITFMGYESQEVPVTNQKALNVVMKEKKEVLDDVVVTGYANVKKSSFTGNAVRVEREDLLKVAPRNIISALQVFDPSLRIMKNNEMGSDPNTLPEFYIRGRSGIGVKELDKSSVSRSALKNNPNTPIFIMDGYEIEVEKVYDFDPNRIASITILKDAAATAIYGSRAANGVVVIETVAPSPGKLRVSYSFTGALTTPDVSDYNLMNASEKLEAERLADYFVSADEVSGESLHKEYVEKQNNILAGVNTDWISQPLTNQFNHKHSLFVEGGTKDIRFGIDLKYDQQNGVMKESFRNRVGAGFMVDYKINNLQIRNQVTYDVVKATNSPYGSFSEYTQRLPYAPFTDEKGNLLQSLKWHAGKQQVNPFYEAKLLNNFDKNGYSDLTDNLGVNWYISDVLQAKGQFSITKKDEWSKSFTDPLSAKYGTEMQNKTLRGELTTYDTESINWNLNVFMNYVQSIAHHNLNVSLGINAVENQYNTRSIHYRGFPSGKLNSPSYAEDSDSPTFIDNHARLFGAFMTLNYSYRDIYLLDASVRLDGSSEFGTEKKTAPFYSVGAGVNIHKYAFMKNNKTFSQLRVTGTFGQLGKTNFPPYAAKHTYEIAEKYYGTGNAVHLYYMGNESLTWEKTNTYDLKLDIGLLEDRVTLKTAWYNKRTKGLITDVTIPTSTGFNEYKDNLGEVENKGLELDFRADIIRNKDMGLAFFGNLAHNKNRICKISESLKAYNDQVNDEFDKYNDDKSNKKFSKPLLKYTEGGSLTSIWGMQSLGINPSDGAEIFLNPDGAISYDWVASQQQILGNEEPDAQGSFGLNFQYKNLSIFATFMYEFGGEAYNSTLVDKVECVDLRYSNADKRVLTARWQKEGDISTFKSIKDWSYTTRPTSRFVQSSNTIDFKSLTIAYDLNTNMIQRWGFSMLRFQFNMEDVAHFSSVKQERGLSYPYARTFNFSLYASF